MVDIETPGGIPTIETERLRLRPFREADVLPLYDLMQDPDVVRYIGDRRVPTQPDAWRMVAGWLGHWTLRGYGLWAVEERAARRFIGRIGIINPLGWPGPEVGWTLGKAWWGHGYATEGARAAIAWGFEQHRFEELISLIDPANSSSIRVAERLGEHRLREMELLSHEVLAYGIRRARWEGPS